MTDRRGFIATSLLAPALLAASSGSGFRARSARVGL